MTQIRDYAAEYDQHLLTKARQLAELHDLPQMRAYLVELGQCPDLVASLASAVVASLVLGRLQATTLELVRWLERIPEAHRG